MSTTITLDQFLAAVQAAESRDSQPPTFSVQELVEATGRGVDWARGMVRRHLAAGTIRTRHAKTLGINGVYQTVVRYEVVSAAPATDQTVGTS